MISTFSSSLSSRSAHACTDTFVADVRSRAECVCAEQKSQSYASSIELTRRALLFCTLIALSATYPSVLIHGLVCGQVDKLFMTDSEYHKHIAVSRREYFQGTPLLLDLSTHLLFLYLFHNYLYISKFMFIRFKHPFIDKKLECIT